MTSVGENIKLIRIARGLTQKQLGDLCVPKMADSAIRRYERGDANPKIETVNRIAQALGVHISDLLQGAMYQNYSYEELKNTSDFLKSNYADTAFNGILAMIGAIYGKIEIKSINGFTYYLIGQNNDQFILYDEDIDFLYELTEKEFIPIIERIKDTTPENEVIKEFQENTDDSEWE